MGSGYELAYLGIIVHDLYGKKTEDSIYSEKAQHDFYSKKTED